MDAERADELKEKYNRLKQANKVLKDGLLEKQRDYGQLEQQLKEKEATVRQQLEEIDQLQFQHGRLSKNLGNVTAQLEEQKQKQQQQGGGWSIGGLMGGQQQAEAIHRAEEQTRILQDELMQKIQENEELHMQVIETATRKEEELEKIRSANAIAVQELDTKTLDLDDTRRRLSNSQKDNAEMTSKNEQLRDEIEAARFMSETLRGTLASEKTEARKRIALLDSELDRWVPFLEVRHGEWNGLNLCSQEGHEAHQREKAVQNLQASVLEVCRHGGDIFRIWSRVFGGGSDDESAKRLRLRSKMSDVAEELGKLMSERGQGLFQAVDLAQMREQVWEEDFASASSALLSRHRKWVLYQSMLLLHDWNSSFASRSAQEEAQAQRFVDWLWRLHRSVRMLVARLRLIACMRGLAAGGRSATHFDLARRALKGGWGASPDAAGAWGAVPDGAPAAAAAETSAAAPKLAAAAVRQPAAELATRLLQAWRAALQDVSQCWEGVGRCLSNWAAAQSKPSSPKDPSSQEGGSVVELLEVLHKFGACMAERIGPAVGELAATAPCPARLAPGQRSAASGGVIMRPVGYIGRAASRLAQAPSAIGFDEAVQTQALAQRLSAAGTRISSELQQQVRRLQAVTDEKAALADDLRALQDDHALLQSNFKVLQDRSAVAATSAAAAAATAAAAALRSSGSTAAAPAATPGAAATTGAPGAANAAGPSQAEPPQQRPLGSTMPGDVILSSRQRALLESLSVTAQESSALRQHGFFVDVITLSPSDVALACGAPEGDADSSWELAVRRVYEQHTRQLQAQIHAADGKTMDLHSTLQQNVDFLRQEDGAKQQLKDETKAIKAQLANNQEDHSLTRKNYDSQLAMLTEHICTLSAQMAEKDASLSNLQKQRVICGRCGMWNAMGKLLAKEAGGACQTCKEKVLSNG